MSRTALVTGGAGFIGGHLVARLIDSGWNVRVLDNFSSGSRAGLSGYGTDIEVIEADVRDVNASRNACKGVDTVFHMAAIASVINSVEDPLLSHNVTLTGTLNVLLGARDQNVRRVIFSSSASVYGDAETVPTSESQRIMPQSPYASAKACGEFYCRNFWDLYQLETVVLRYFNVFGPGQNANSGYAAVIPRFVQAAITHTSPTIYGDGLQTRDFVYVGNVASANVLAAESRRASGETFNVAGGAGISLLDMLEVLRGVTGARLEPCFQPGRPGEVRHSRADVSHAREILGYQPEVSLEQGLERTVATACDVGHVRSSMATASR